MGSALLVLLICSLASCLTLTALVVVRKRRRDRGESLFAARRERMKAAVLAGDQDELRSCLAEATRDPNAQVDLAVALDMLRSDLDTSRIAHLREASEATGLDAALAAATTHRQAAVRGRAALLLGRMRAPGTAALVASLLTDTDADVRLTAAGSLSIIADDAAARALIEALVAEILPPERVLERLGAPWAVNTILRALAEENIASAPRVAHGRSLRASLGAALGLAGDSCATFSLARLLTFDDPEERVAAARALATAGTRHAVPALVGALGDPEWTVRAQAAKALGALGAVEAIVELEARLSDPAWWVRSNAATALRVMGTPGLEALQRALHSGDRYARDRAREALDFASVVIGAAG